MPIDPESYLTPGSVLPVPLMPKRMYITREPNYEGSRDSHYLYTLRRCTATAESRSTPMNVIDDRHHFNTRYECWFVDEELGEFLWAKWPKNDGKTPDSLLTKEQVRELMLGAIMALAATEPN